MGKAQFLSTAMPVRAGTNVTVFTKSLFNTIEQIQDGDKPFTDRQIWKVSVIQNAGVDKRLIRCLEQIGVLNQNNQII